MTRVKNPFLLPERKPLDTANQNYQPKVFKQWVEDLPVANAAESAQQLFNRIEEMNQREFPVADRIRNLEMLLEPVQCALEALSKQYLREPLPLNRRSRLISRLTQSLYLLVIVAYKVALDQYHQQSMAAQMLHKSNRALALHRVLYFLSQVQLHAYQLYQPPPRNFWKEIHGIHQYAVDQKLADRAIGNEDVRLVGESSASDIYKQMLLLSLAGPFRLMQGEVAHIYMALQRWAPKCKLLEHKGLDLSQGAFLVDLSRDEPPRYREEIGEPTLRKGWIINTDALAEMLGQELEVAHAPAGVMRPQVAPDAVTPELLARLMVTWGIGVVRVGDRSQAPGEVILTFGMDGLYQKLEGEEAPELFAKGLKVSTMEEQEISEKRERLAVDEHLVEGGSDLARFAEWVEKGADAAGFLPEVKDTMEQSYSLTRNCLVFDQSDHGYHLGLVGTGNDPVRVGELVGVSKRAESDSKIPRLGVIRWMRSDKPGLLDFGIELLSERIEPVIFRRQRTDQKEFESWRSFLHYGEDEGDTLITPSFFSEENDQIFLVHDRMVKPLILDRVVEATPSFVRFHFREVEKKEQVAEQESLLDQEDATQEFSKLWNSI